MLIPNGKFGKSLLRLAGRLSKTKPSQIFSTSPPVDQVDPQYDLNREKVIKMERTDELTGDGYENDGSHIRAMLNSPNNRLPFKRQNVEQIDDQLDTKRRRPSDTMIHQNTQQNSPDSGWNSGELSDSSIPSPSGINNDHGRIIDNNSIKNFYYNFIFSAFAKSEDAQISADDQNYPKHVVADHTNLTHTVPIVQDNTQHVQPTGHNGNSPMVHNRDNWTIDRFIGDILVTFRTSRLNIIQPTLTL